MAEETKQQQPQGWKDVNINGDIPLSAIIQFLNILNQRLVAVEDNVKLPVDNKLISLTELYALQAQAEQEEMAKRAAEAAEKKEEK